jgi:hypothetical protein
MKISINIKSLSFLSFLFLATFYVTSALSIDSIARAPQCTGNSTGTIDPSSGVITDEVDKCDVQPDTQKLTFYSITLCAAKPTPPTSTTAHDLSNFSIWYENASGSEVTVSNGTATAIGTEADYSVVPYGNYTYAIMEFDPVFKFKASVTMDVAVNDFRGGTSGSTTCVTKVTNESDGIIYGFENFSGTDNAKYLKSNVDCASGAVAAEISVGLNAMTIINNNECVYEGSYAGTDETVEAYAVKSDGKLQTTGGACTAGASNSISRVFGYLPVSLDIDDRTTGFQIRYNNTRGLGLKFDDNTLSDPFKLEKIELAFFDMTGTLTKN